MMAFILLPSLRRLEVLGEIPAKGMAFDPYPGTTVTAASELECKTWNLRAFTRRISSNAFG